ncbi:MAG: peptidoglycan-binding protein [Deltaproteobacteria bacterium]|nr:peptidoglycan-binding protein [Deltaproteobacteria bacterium]
MYKRTLFNIVFIVLCLFFCGCVTTTTSNSPVDQSLEKGLIIAPPDRTIVDWDRQPVHIRLVLAAMVNKLSGDREILQDVVFDPNGDHAFYDTDFFCDEFDLQIVQITGFEIQSQTNHEARLVVEGVFNFSDLFGRGIANYFAAAYTVHKNGITITRSGTALIAPAIPDIEVFFVPESSFNGMDMKEISSYMDLYIHAVLHAFPMEPTEKERQDMDAYEKMSVFKKVAATMTASSEDCFIMAFCKDRLPPESSLAMKVTDKPGSQGSEIFKTGYIYDQGWRVMIAGGHFNPDDRWNNFYANILYNTDPESKRRNIIIGSYTNKKNYDDTPKYIVKPLGKSIEPLKAQPLPNPIESGAIFLNPAKVADAIKIQTRLASKGYYKKKVDGIFGPGSQNALIDFKKDNGLGDNNTWDLKTQKLLFRDSGL